MSKPNTVYMCWSEDGEPVYIGRTANLTARLRQHKSKPWWGHVSLITHTEPMDAYEADRFERRAIFLFEPWANCHHRAFPILARRAMAKRLAA